MINIYIYTKNIIDIPKFVHNNNAAEKRAFTIIAELISNISVPDFPKINITRTFSEIIQRVAIYSSSRAIVAR